MLYLSAGSALTGLKCFLDFFMIIHLENSCFQPPNNHYVSLWYKLAGKSVSLKNKLMYLFKKRNKWIWCYACEVYIILLIIVHFSFDVSHTKYLVN